jgi:hypothetical protein
VGTLTSHNPIGLQGLLGIALLFALQNKRAEFLGGLETITERAYEEKFNLQDQRARCHEEIQVLHQKLKTQIEKSQVSQTGVSAADNRIFPFYRLDDYQLMTIKLKIIHILLLKPPHELLNMQF